MGVWGYRPYDSDDAQDWLGDIESFIVKQIKKATRSGTPNEVIAAAGLLTELDDQPIDLCCDAASDGLYHKMIVYLEKLKADDAWITTWDNPELIGVNIGVLILRLQAVALDHADIEARTAKVFRHKRGAVKIPRRNKYGQFRGGPKKA